MSFAIHSLTDQHIGFLLFSDDRDNHQCIFQGLPVKGVTDYPIDATLIEKLQQLGHFNYTENDKGFSISHQDYPITAEITDGRLQISDAQFNLVAIGTSD